MEHNNYEQMIVSTLKNLARERGLRGYSRLNKSELIRKLREPTPLRDHTRAQLIQLARERGLRGYSRLRKSQLLQRLRALRDQILDWDNDAGMANVPFLTPTPYTPTQAAPTPSPSSNDVEELKDYLGRATRRPENLSYRSASELRRLLKLKRLLEEIDKIFEEMKIFEVKESNSALRNFAKVYTIDGKLGYDTKSFLDGEYMTKVLRDNRNTKVKLILKCYLDFPTRNEIKPANFHSCIEVNLDGTNEEELYDTMVDRVLENIAKYMAMGGDVRFHIGIKFELHTASYKPLREETWIPLPKELADKKAIINMQNEDNKCFLWCVLRALNPKD